MTKCLIKGEFNLTWNLDIINYPYKKGGVHMKRKILILLLVCFIIVFNFSSIFAQSSYIVKPDDVLWRIAKSYGTTWQELSKINQLENPNLIFPGQMILLDGSEPNLLENDETEKAYSFISQDIMINSRALEIPGTFVYPEGTTDETFPLVVMAHGHGGTRDEAGGFISVAEKLAANGIASIRVDFPGCGESSESFSQNNITNMLMDIDASLNYALSQPMIDSDRVGIYGYSMGGRLAILSASRNSIYKSVALWAPAATDGASSMYAFIGGEEAYKTFNEEADEKGSALFTTLWGQEQLLGKQFFEDMNTTKPQEEIAEYTGSLLIVSGDKDTIIDPSICKAIVSAATNSSEVKEHVVNGADHGFGLYSNEPELSNEAINTTIDFLINHLK